MINFKEIDIYEWKGKFINHIVNKYNFKNYLELGIGNGDDINPLNFAETGPNSSVDVYRFWMLLSDFFDLETILGPQDDALGIFRATNTLTENHISSILNSKMEYNYSLFEEKRNDIIHKKIISLQ
jgi:hypothetical protein